MAKNPPYTARSGVAPGPPGRARAVALLDEALEASRGHGAVLLRILAFLTFPAALVTLLVWTLELGGGGPEGAGSLSALLAGHGSEALLPLVAAALPPLFLLALTAMTLAAAGATAGWQLLYGRVPSPAGVLLSLYARRWRLLGLLGVEILARALALGVVLGPLAYALLYGGDTLPPWLLDRVFPVAAYLGTLPVSFGLCLAVPALMVEDLGPLRAVARGVALLALEPLTTLLTWGGVQLLGLVGILNLQSLLLGEGLFHVESLLPAMRGQGAPTLLGALFFQLLPVPLTALVMVGVYRHIRQRREALDVELALRALPEVG